MPPTAPTAPTISTISTTPGPALAPTVRRVHALGMALGEGLHWDHARAQLWWVDIVGRRLYRWDLVAAAPSSWTLPQRCGWVLPQADGDALLLGLQGGFARATLEALDTPDWLARPFAEGSTLRLNDAKADASGAVWGGSLNHGHEDRPEGVLFRLGTDGELRTVDAGYRVANGPALRGDGRLLLHTDSPLRSIYAFDLDVAGGEVTGKRIWKRFDEAEGYPDGMCFDAERCVWVAHWGGSCVSRFDPDGALLRRWTLPTPHITNVCFAGPGLDRVFVTSAAVGSSGFSAPEQACAGDLFEIDGGGVKGLQAHPWRGAATGPTR